MSQKIDTDPVPVPPNPSQLQLLWEGRTIEKVIMMKPNSRDDGHLLITLDDGQIYQIMPERSPFRGMMPSVRVESV